MKGAQITPARLVATPMMVMDQRRSSPLFSNAFQEA